MINLLTIIDYHRLLSQKTLSKSLTLTRCCTGTKSYEFSLTKEQSLMPKDGSDLEDFNAHVYTCTTLNWTPISERLQEKNCNMQLMALD